MQLDFSSLLTWAGLAVSFYNTISLLWLGIMVMLLGNRRSAGTWLVCVGMLLGALFFTSHTAILGRGLSETGFGMNFWWWVSWAPAVVAPLAWYGAMLWHTGFRFDAPHPHRLWLAAAVGLAFAVVLLIVFANPLPSYLYVAGRGLMLSPSLGGIPLLVWAYMAFGILCYLLPLDLLRRPDPAAGTLAGRSRAQARPWLVAASVAMLLAGGVLVWTALWALKTSPLPSLKDPVDEQIVRQFDLAVAALVALAITTLGRAIVTFEVFTGRALPRDRFYNQWRTTVLMAAGFGGLAAFALAFDVRPAYGFLFAAVLAAAFFALYAWRSYAEREAFMERLRPFVSSQNLYAKLTEPDKPGENLAGGLFEALCRDILAAREAVLIPAGALATFSGPPLKYPPGAALAPPSIDAWAGNLARETRCLPAGAPGFVWAIPLWSENGLAGLFFLGEKSGGGRYSEEEIELAQAAGERLLDMQAGSEVARLSLELLRQRVTQSRVLEGQSRRVLHDEVLPELHTSALELSGLAASHPEVLPAVENLSAAHRRISDLLRSVAQQPGAPALLSQQGLVAALRALVEGDLAGEFDRVDWRVDDPAEERARSIQPFAAEVIYFAARELLRNAARYARGKEPDRQVALCVSLELAGQHLRLIIEDDGVGLAGEPSAGGGSGLRLHSAMLAAVGASLAIGPRLGGGTRAVIESNLS